MEPEPGRITRLLNGEGLESEQLAPLLYDELRRIAQQRMSLERPDHTLQATALVHEVYARLVGYEGSGWRDRAHFFATAAQAMRRVLVDHARRAQSLKRGGEQMRITLGAVDAPVEYALDAYLSLDVALDRLEREDPRAAEVTKLRFFVGLSVPEAAESLGVSQRTVEREWAFAKARLSELLVEEEDA